MTRRIALLALLTVVVGTTIAAQQYPTQEKGFDPTKLYHFTDLDSINTFNGNLILPLPVTPTFRVGPALSYSFTPIYNANVWDSRMFDAEHLSLTPCRRCNAGLGWTLSLGRLVPPSDPTNSQNDDNRGFLYESPDGRDHGFPSTQNGRARPYYLFSIDESGLRLQVTDTAKIIEFPDGTKRQFGSDGNGGWRLEEISDRFDNHIYVDYSRSSTGHEIWDITEKEGSTTIRSHSVEFNVTADGSASSSSSGTTFAQTYVTKIVTSAFAGKTTEYVFNYTRTKLYRPPDDTMDPDPEVTAVWVFLLTGIDLVTRNEAGQLLSAPTLGSYTMALPDGYETCGTGCDSSGLLKQLRLPTGGTYKWTWTTTTYPLPEAMVAHVNPDPTPIEQHRRQTVGVSTRELVDFNPATSAKWYYSYVTSHEQCTDPQDSTQVWRVWKQTATAVSAPDGTTSVNYYSIYPESDPCNNDENGAWVAANFGLPVTGWALDSSGLALSTETYDGTPPTTAPSFTMPTKLSPHLSAGTLKRTKRILNGSVTSPSGAGTFFPTIERVYYNDDPDQFTETIYSKEDLAGHFRQVSSGGTIGGTVYRTTFTGYPTMSHALGAPEALATWLFGPYSEQCSRIESTARERETVSSCSALLTGATAQDSNWKQFCFNSSTGFLSRQRNLRSTSPGAHDVLAVFTPSSTGDVASEAYYGADVDRSGTAVAGLGAGDVCSVTIPATASYTINHTYSAGTLATSYYSNALFKNVERVVDAGTGLVASEKDSAEVETVYHYDLAGRLTDLKTTDLAMVNFTYSRASLTGTLSNAKAASSQTGTGTEGTRGNTYLFDGFGRVIRELAKTENDGLRGHAVTYDAMGRKNSDTVTWSFASETAAPPTQKTTTVYDFAGRPKSITAPDSAQTTIAYTGIRQVARTSQVAGTSGSQNATTTETNDALGRLVTVQEPAGGSTATYGYDAADRLTSVSMTDGSMPTPQARSFAYDNCGFLISETHPELGLSGNGSTTYSSYDAKGHAHHKVTGTTGGLFDLTFTYDAAERLTSVLHSGTSLKTFVFGDSQSTPPLNSKGKVITATRKNTVEKPANVFTDVLVTENYTYGGLAGSLSAKSTSVKIGTTDVQTFSQSFASDTLGSPFSLTYPSISIGTGQSGTTAPPARTVENVNRNGFLVGVDGYSGTRGGTDGITYLENGMIGSVVHNGATGSPAQHDDQTISDTNRMARPASIKFVFCTPPTLDASQPADQSLPLNGSTTLSITPPAGSPTYQWYRGDSGDKSNPISGGTTASLNTGSLTQTTKYWVAVSDQNCPAYSRTATVTVATCTAPDFSTPAAPTVGYGQSAILTINPAATGTAPLTYQWYLGSVGIVTNPVGTNSSSFTSPALNATTRYWVRVSNSCGSKDSTTMVIHVVLPTPTNLSASWSQGGGMSVQWQASAGASRYVVERCDGTSCVALNPHPTSSPFPDSGVALGHTYKYRVSAVDATEESASSPSNPDIATTMTFAAVTSSPLPVIAAAHLEELLTAINRVRVVANPTAAPLTWTDVLSGYTHTTAPASSGAIYADHLLALRQRMNEALQSIGMPTPGYAENVAAGASMTAEAVAEIQRRAQ